MKEGAGPGPADLVIVLDPSRIQQLFREDMHGDRD